MASRPDIILLVLDTQRADRLSCYGYPAETSPNIDALAADATRFNYAMSAAQWTVPSHASMFTGLYPSAHNTLQADSRLPKAIPALAERLRDGGYFTAGFCNNPLVGVVDTGMRRGFYSFLSYSGWLTSRPNQAGMRPTWVDRYRQVFKRLLGGVVGKMQDAFARSDALLEFSFTPFMVPLWQTALSFKGNTARTMEDLARLHIERKGIAQDQPIFSFVNLMGTHAPYHPPRRFVERFAPRVLRDKHARTFLRRFNSDIYGWLAPLAGEIDEDRKEILDGIYDAEIAAQDERIGACIDKLRAAGRLDKTLLMVVADHGDHHGEKQLIGHSFSLYNELIHVPLIVRDPSGDFVRGATDDQFVSTRRIFHTALASAGLATPDEERFTLAQRGASDPDEGVVFSEAIPPSNVLHILSRKHADLIRERRCDQTRRAVSSDRYKLIMTGQDAELYDMVDDPTEQTNLRDILPEQVEDLSERLDAFVANAGSAAPAPEHAVGQDDPLVRRRLRDLGYLE